MYIYNGRRVSTRSDPHPYGRVPGFFLLRVTVPGRAEHVLRFSSYTAHRWSVIRSLVISIEYSTDTAENGDATPVVALPLNPGQASRVARDGRTE